MRTLAFRHLPIPKWPMASIPWLKKACAHQAAPTSFDFEPRTRLNFAENAVDRVGDLAVELSARKILLVTDPGIVAAGHAARVIALLERQHLKVVCFDQVEENPSTRCVERCVE